VRWHRVVLDEAQTIKNHRTLAAHSAWRLHARHRWAAARAAAPQAQPHALLPASPACPCSSAARRRSPLAALQRLCRRPHPPPDHHHLPPLRLPGRWCLSGTPVQNTLDDLLSYFRFLRYQPYCHPKQFKELIKDKVAANQDKGFKVGGKAGRQGAAGAAAGACWAAAGLLEAAGRRVLLGGGAWVSTPACFGRVDALLLGSSALPVVQRCVPCHAG
jgi:hypothetical protein